MQRLWHWVGSILVVSGAAQAQEAPTVYVQGGMGQHSAYSAMSGVTLPWKTWSWSLGHGTVRGHWDGYAGAWSSRPDGAERRSTWVLGFGPSLRWRGSGGTSPWFAEAGTSVNLSSRHYQSGSDRFSTRYNFASHVGFGRNFGAQRLHEISLRVQHISNASIKSPNPGENFVLLRYAKAF